MKSLLNTWKNSPINNLLHIKFPVIQAPMAGGATTPELIAAVCNAGALGSLGAGFLKADILAETIDKIRQLTVKPFAVNLFVPGTHTANLQQQQAMCDKINRVAATLKINVAPVELPYNVYYTEQMQVLIEKKVPIFSFTFGIPETDYLNKLKANNTILIGTATSTAEAVALETAGVDLIVAQGSEAGGHRGTFIGNAEDSCIGLFALLPQITKVTKLPVIAAGGIMNGSGVVAALALGAAGVQMGTAFLSCHESGIHPAYKTILKNCKHDNTVLTKAVSGKLARGIRNQYITAMSRETSEFLDYPIQHVLTQTMRIAAAAQNNAEFMALFAGQSASLCRDLPAADLVFQINEEVNDLLA